MAIKPVGIDDDGNFVGRAAAALNATFGHGFAAVAVAGQSLAGGTGATADEDLDYDFEGLYWWGVTPDETGYHQINPFTSLPLPGGLIGTRPYGLMGALITARMQYLDTGLPQLIIPVFLGGSGFYNHNVLAGRWLVSETTHPNLAQLSTDEINLALTAAAESFGPTRDFSIIWNQGEADRDVSTSEGDYADAFDALVGKWRDEITVDNAATFPIVVSRQLPERRAVDGSGKEGVDLAQLDTPGRLPYTAVIHPPVGYANEDNTHANAGGQRIMGRLYHEALGRARLNRPSMAATPVVNLTGDELGTITWESPLSGRVEELSVRYREDGGSWSSPATLRAGVREFAPTVAASTEVDYQVTTVASPGDSLPAEITLTTGTPDISTGLLFDFNADDLSLADGASLTGGDWVSGSGSVTGLAFSAVGGTAPTCEDDDAALPGHKLVRFVSGSLATATDAVSISDGTYVLLMRAREATSVSQLVMTGASQLGHVLFMGATATTIAFRTGSSGGTAASTDLGNWIVLVARKDGTNVSILTETVAGVQSSSSATEDEATQTQLVLSNGPSTRAKIDLHRFMGFSRVLGSLDIPAAVQSLFEAAGLR